MEREKGEVGIERERERTGRSRVAESPLRKKSQIVTLSIVYLIEIDGRVTFFSSLNPSESCEQGSN